MLSKRLEKYSNANQPTLATLATSRLATPSDNEVVSNWWLIHFTDTESVEVAIWPPCNHADALALNPNAVAVKPLPPQVMEVANG